MPKQALSLDDFDDFETKHCVNSPRSVEACRREGVLPAELLHTSLDKFQKSLESKKHAKLRYDFMEAKRRDALEAVRIQHNLIIEEEDELEEMRARTSASTHSRESRGGRGFHKHSQSVVSLSSIDPQLQQWNKFKKLKTSLTYLDLNSGGHLQDQPDEIIKQTAKMERAKRREAVNLKKLFNFEITTRTKKAEYERVLDEDREKMKMKERVLALQQKMRNETMWRQEQEKERRKVQRQREEQKVALQQFYHEQEEKEARKRMEQVKTTRLMIQRAENERKR